MSKPCKILCAKCGKPLRLTGVDITFLSAQGKHPAVMVQCYNKDCGQYNTHPIFDHIEAGGRDWGEKITKARIREAIGAKRDEKL